MAEDLAAILLSPSWYKALSLRERAAAAGGACPLPGNLDGPDAGAEADSIDATARAARLLQRWQAQSPFSRDGYFARRLAVDGLDVGQLAALLAEAPEALAARIRAAARASAWDATEGAAGTAMAAATATTADTPAAAGAGGGAADSGGDADAPGLPWLVDLTDAFTRQPAAGEPRFPIEVTEECGRLGPLLAVVRPLLDRGYGRLAAALAELVRRTGTTAFAAADAARLLAAGLPRRLGYLLGRCLAVELQLAAAAGQLSGDTPDERHAHFAVRLADPQVALALLCKYPVAARQVVELIGQWGTAGLCLCADLAADAPRLAELLDAPRGVGTLCGLDPALGDPHRGGRSVCRLRFDSGLEVIYKPRSMAVEVAFQDLLAWTARRGFRPKLARLRVLDAGGHGWVEVVRAAPCASAAEIQRFYERQGGYLALLFALSATDMHSENLIAAGEHPILVDLEALFHPFDEDWGRPGSALTPVPDTVLRVGLLPAKWGGKDARDGIDLSALAAVAGQLTPRPVLRAQDVGTDRMRYLHEPMEMPVGEHRPTLCGAAVDLAPHAAAVADGCERMLRLLAAHRDELLADDGPLAAFVAAPVRVLVRLTLAYGTLMVDALHPFALRDGLERDRLFDRLWAVTAEQPALGRLVPAERRDLWRGDVPLFTALAAGRDVWTSDGERLDSLLGKSGLDGVRDRLRRLDDAEIARQVWLVVNSLHGATGTMVPRRSYAPEGAAPALAAGDLLDAALAIGRRLDALAFRSRAGTVWFGSEAQGGSIRTHLGPAGPDLYLGVPGIALFFAQLGAVLAAAAAAGQAGVSLDLAGRWTALARSAVWTLRDQTGPDSEVIDSIGAFSGWGGVLYTLTHLGLLWGDSSLLDEAEVVAERLAPAVAADENCDVVGGAAGCLVCLLGLWRHRPKPRLLALATACGEQLLARAVQPQSPARGIAWVLPPAGPLPLAGFGHGAAGIAWALLQLADAGGDARFRAAALAAFDYERSLFSPGAGNWPDLRAGAGPPDGGPHFMSAWCHGAAGIAMGRLDSLRRLAGAERESACDEARIAVATTLATGFGNNHCLCHGDLGCLEAVALAAEVLPEPELARRAGRIAGGVLADIRHHGWRHGLVTDVEAPGMMIGLAGIGYGLLRLAAPACVPSVLLLDLPTGKAAVTGGKEPG